MAPIAGRHFLGGGRDGAIAQLGERVVRNDEVGGSIPPGSTSLRRLRLLRLGKPSRSEGCPAIARRATADQTPPFFRLSCLAAHHHRGASENKAEQPCNGN